MKYSYSMIHQLKAEMEANKRKNAKKEIFGLLMPILMSVIAN